MMHSRIYLGLAVLLVLAGCEPVDPPVSLLESSNSQSQTLELFNNGNKTLTIYPQEDSLPPVKIDPKKPFSFTFIVVEIATLKMDEDSGRYRKEDSTERFEFAHTDPSGYLVQSDFDATLRVGRGDEEAYSIHRFTVNGCEGNGWSGGSGPQNTHRVSAFDPDRAVVAEMICPGAVESQ